MKKSVKKDHNKKVENYMNYLKNNFYLETFINLLNLKHDPKNNFYHPKLDKDHTLALHVLYKLSKEDFVLKLINNL